MASPPSFLLFDDDAGDSRNPSPPAASANPTPHGLNDRLLLHLSRSRARANVNPDPNPNPNPPRNSNPNPDAEARKVKLAGRRRLCKLSDAAEEEAGPGGGKEEVVDGVGDGESIRGILDDLTTLLDSLSMEKPKARPRPQVAPVPCLIAEPVEVEYESAASSLRSSLEDAREETKRGSDDEGQCLPSVSELSSPDEVTVINKGVGVSSRGGKASDFRDYDWDDEEEEEEEDEKKGAEISSPDEVRVIKNGAEVKRKGAKASSFRDYGEDDDDDEEENCVDVESDGEAVDWERTEDFRMEATGSSKLHPYTLTGNIFSMLYPHQREGLRWLWVLHCRGTGGILGDDMGLGKTMQIAAFLAGLFHSRLIKRALVVAPKTLLAHWMKELSVVGLKEKIRDYSGTNINVRNYELQCTLKEGGILLTTYDIVRNNYKSIRGSFYDNADDDEEETLWNYVILDEGHIIKNPKTQRAQSLFEIPCVHRVIISGTPIQNNLKEMWALFYFCCPEVLGDKDEFKVRYETPILRGNDKHASNREKHIGSNVAKELRERIKPYFLRRLKSDVFQNDGATENTKLSKKNDLIIWLKLTSCQRQLYEAFLNSELVHSSMQGSPLAAITILKKICDHPLLLTKRAAEGVLEGMDTMMSGQEMGMVERMAMSLADMANDDDALQRDLVDEGHNVLIFSQTRKMLDLIQEALLLEDYKFLRIDGTTKLSDREKIVKDFQEGPGAPIFLLTSQVGGLGLTLTKAARVIVVDPAWNPSTDNQSVDRAYRIGQTKDVIVYRLMTCGTIEEKIYKMQVLKGALFRTATEQKEQTRYFSKRDIQELFSLPPQGFDVSLTQKQLQEEHDQQQFDMDESLRNHIKYLEQQGIAGVSHHNLLFSKTAILPALDANDALESKPRDAMVGRWYHGTSSDSVMNGAVNAFKPKDERFAARTYSPNSNGGKESPEEIKARINRLSQTLANKELVSKLPDGGERIRRQITELDQKITMIDSSPDQPSSRDPEVICVDDLSKDMQNISF